MKRNVHILIRKSTPLQRIIILSIIAGIVFTVGLMVLESREGRFSSLYIYPDSYTNYPGGNTTSFRYGIRSYELKPTSYNLRVLVNDQVVNTSTVVLDPGEVLERPMTLDITGAWYPVKIRLILTSPFDTYDVHYWLKEDPPGAAFSMEPTSGKEPLTVQFTDRSVNSSGYWTWNFGDGSTSDLQNPVHTYLAGTYTVTLVVANSGGEDDETCDSCITVSAHQPPVAAFSGWPTTGMGYITVNFTDESTNSPTSWRWDFGDRGTSSDQNPAHTYSNPGNYTVRLTVSNPDGTAEATRENYITLLPYGG